MNDDWDDSDDDFSDEWDSDIDDSNEWDSDDPDVWSSHDEYPCPHCGEYVFDDSVQCPACGEYITHSTNPWQGKPLWWILLGALGTGATILLLALS